MLHVSGKMNLIKNTLKIKEKSKQKIYAFATWSILYKVDDRAYNATCVLYLCIVNPVWIWLFPSIILPPSISVIKSHSLYLSPPSPSINLYPSFSFSIIRSISSTLPIKEVTWPYLFSIKSTIFTINVTIIINLIDFQLTGKCCIHIAANKDNIDILGLLLWAGANPNARVSIANLLQILPPQSIWLKRCAWCVVLFSSSNLIHPDFIVMSTVNLDD